MVKFRRRIRALVDHPRFHHAITVLVVINGLLLGLETSKSLMASPLGPLVHIADNACLTVFVVELLLVAYAYGIGFIKDPWRIFDTAVIAIALLPSGGGLSVLRGLRVLRVLRVINNAPSLKRIINAMVAAIPGMGSIGALLAIIYYVAGVMATKLFGEAFPEWFGSLGASAYTLFQVMTLESWSMGIVRPIMEKFPYAWAFFIPFIAVATFTMLNLFVGVVVGAMQAAAAAASESSPEPAPTPPILAQKLGALSEQLAEVQKLIAEETTVRKAG